MHCITVFREQLSQRMELLLSSGHSRESKHILYFMCVLVGGRTKRGKFNLFHGLHQCFENYWVVFDRCHWAHGAAFSIQIYFMYKIFYGQNQCFENYWA